MLFGTEEVKETKTNVSAGFVDLDKVVYVGSNKQTRVVFSPLHGYDNDTAIKNEDKIIAHSVTGYDKKVSCAKRLKAYTDKSGVKKFGYDKDEWISCDLCTKHDLSREVTTDKDGNTIRGMGKEAIKSIEIHLVVRLYEISYLITKNDENGQPIKNAKGEYTKVMHTETFDEPKIVTLGLPIGDAYFKTAASGVSKDLARLFKFNKLKDRKISFVYGEVNTIVDEETGDDVKLSKSEMTEINKLRKETNVSSILESHKPMSYKEYYESVFEEEYIYPLGEDGYPLKNKPTPKPLVAKRELVAVGASTSTPQHSEDDSEFPPF